MNMDDVAETAYHIFRKLGYAIDEDICQQLVENSASAGSDSYTHQSYFDEYEWRAQIFGEPKVMANYKISHIGMVALSDDGAIVFALHSRDFVGRSTFTFVMTPDSIECFNEPKWVAFQTEVGSRVYFIEPNSVFPTMLLNKMID